MIMIHETGFLFHKFFLFFQLLFILLVFCPFENAILRKFFIILRHSPFLRDSMPGFCFQRLSYVLLYFLR
jgi:hypothetical protein